MTIFQVCIQLQLPMLTYGISHHTVVQICKSARACEDHLVRFVRIFTSVPKTKIAEFANSVDLNEVAHHEPPHLDLHCLHSSLKNLNVIQLGLKFFF